MPDLGPAAFLSISGCARARDDILHSRISTGAAIEAEHSDPATCTDRVRSLSEPLSLAEAKGGPSGRRRADTHFRTCYRVSTSLSFVVHSIGQSIEDSQ